MIQTISLADRERIAKTESFLKSKFDGGIFLSNHPEEKAYRLEHSYRVANIGAEIARKEGFDVTEMVIACLLHDLAYCEEFGEEGWKEHGRRSATLARPFLTELGLPEDRIQDICYGIAIHVDDEADFPGERTPFALSVGDADNIDRFDAYRIHEMLYHEKFLEKNFEEKKEFISARLAWLQKWKDMPVGTKTAADLWQARHAFYVAFLERLGSQLEHSQSVSL